MQHEKRLFRRYSPQCYKLYVSEDNNNWHESKLINLSADGMRFETNKPINSKNVSIALSLKSVMDEQNFNFNASVIWCSKNDENSDSFTYGVYFNNFPLYKKARFNTLLDKQVL